jgi:competence protein ComEA
MNADASPQKQSFIRFRLSGLAGRQVTGARLRLHQVDASPLGGRVLSMSSTAWSESVSWNTRPAIDGALLGSFSAVSAGNWYEVELGPAAVRDGVVSYAIDSTSSDGVRWSTRQSATPPRLLVTVDDPPGAIVDGLSQVAATNAGSSEPTYFAANHRLAVTAGGRLLAVHGRHASGVQLAWRDPAGGWQTRSTGASLDGSVLSGTGTGDWPASIAVTRDATGLQHAWVVWSGTNVGGLRPVQMRRITNLDSADGQHLGPLVSVDPAPRGAYKSDIGFERAPDGEMRGCILYSRRVGDSAYELTAVWFTDLTSETPALTDRATLETSASSAHYGSLVQSAAGLRAVTRAGGATRRADLGGLNLAAKVQDGRQVLVPERAPRGMAPASAGAGAAPAEGQPLNVNTATLEQLDLLSGIGPVTAQKILDFREERGGFGSVEELGEIPGIGDKRLASLREELTL